jgi:hypothetical protein
MGFGFLGAQIGVTLDPDHGQDDNRCGLVGRFAAEAHDAPVFREFDNVAHQPLSSAADKEALCPDARKSVSP